MAATAFAIEQSRHAQARHLPGPCHDDFLRLSRTLIHGPEFQWLLVEAPNESLRRQVITALDNVLQLAGLSSNRLPLSAKILDVPMLEERLVKIARSAAVVHVQDQSGWFDAARWEAFNTRRERLASKARSKLVFWLDAEAIALTSRCAPDLWSWRGGVYSFVPETMTLAALPSAPSSGDITIDARIDRDNAFRSSPYATDTRSMAERSRRVVEIKAWLARHPEAPDELKVSPIDELGRLLFSLGDYDNALEHWQHIELPMFHRLNDSRSAAITQGQIADILKQRGDNEEALRIHREEQLPVYERLGDVRSRAITMGKIADILQVRGDSEEALRILREEVFPALEGLGDLRSQAMTMGKIADILQDRGDIEEALRIHREEELPVYERLSDVHSQAVTMGQIADILQDRGDIEEALRIYRDEELPVYEQLGEVRSRAITMGQIADILQQRGDSEEALRILREEVFPALEGLGDVRSQAVTMGKIAVILQQRGDSEEALRILCEEVLPAAERIQDMALIANTLYKCATVRLSFGVPENQVDAQNILEELKRSFELICQLKHVDAIAVVGSLFGKQLMKGGFVNEAITVLEKAADAFEVLQKPDKAAKLRELVDKLQDKVQ
jgi:tetratricopeptide (TPR) repeat protein